MLTSSFGFAECTRGLWPPFVHYLFGRQDALLILNNEDSLANRCHCWLRIKWLVCASQLTVLRIIIRTWTYLSSKISTAIAQTCFQSSKCVNNSILTRRRSDSTLNNAPTSPFTKSKASLYFFWCVRMSKYNQRARFVEDLLGLVQKWVDAAIKNDTHPPRS